MPNTPAARLDAITVDATLADAHATVLDTGDIQTGRSQS
jgi:hypothetical protein